MCWKLKEIGKVYQNERCDGAQKIFHWSSICLRARVNPDYSAHLTPFLAPIKKKKY